MNPATIALLAQILALAQQQITLFNELKQNDPDAWAAISAYYEQQAQNLAQAIQNASGSVTAVQGEAVPLTAEQAAAAGLVNGAPNA